MQKNKVIIIGSGIGGLSAALQLTHEGHTVEIFDSLDMPGGKMRTVPSPAGPVDAGPTVFTLKHLFDAFFNQIGEKMENHFSLSMEPLVARHFWKDGSVLDLSNDYEKNIEALTKFSGRQAASEFKVFDRLSRELFSSFESPILKSPEPSIFSNSLSSFYSLKRIFPALLPNRTLFQLNQRIFTDTRLQQLFSRYATYVGGSPYESPAILSLIWRAESLGVWRIKGGMHKLPSTIMKLARERGAKFYLQSTVKKILIKEKRVVGIRLLNDKEFYANNIIFNGDPKALYDGILGQEFTKILKKKNVYPRSLSAYVWSFSAKSNMPNLAHHNVFFNENYKTEFEDIKKGLMPKDPTLYVCAQDRGNIKPGYDSERFEIIMNAAPKIDSSYREKEEYELCRKITFGKLKQLGLNFDQTPSEEALTTPTKFNHLFPSSSGSLYGLSPSKMMTTFTRPKARSGIPGLYLAGGGVHPGPGIPMAMLSGKHAAATIIKDLTLT